MGSCLVSGTWFLIVKVQRDSGFLALHYGFQSPGSRNSAIKISRIKKIQITLNARTHILLDYRCIPNIANTEDYPWREYKVGRGVEAKIPPLEDSLLMGVSKYLVMKFCKEPIAFV